MKTDDFEKRLQQAAPRIIPSAWRKEILTAAELTSPSRHPSPASRHNWCLTILQRLSTLPLPRRAAWASLGATWILIVLMHLSTRATSSPNTQIVSLPSTESLQVMRREKLQLLAELNGQPIQRAKEQPKPHAIQPHSQRRTLVGTV